MGSPPPKLSNPPVFFYETGGTAREEGKGREGEGVRVGELRGGFSGGGRLEVEGERGGDGGVSGRLQDFRGLFMDRERPVERRGNAFLQSRSGEGEPKKVEGGSVGVPFLVPPRILLG